MLEILAVFLTLGSITYHFNNNIFDVSLIGFTFAVSLFFLAKPLLRSPDPLRGFRVKNFKGFIFCFLILTTFLLGALNTYKSESTVPKNVFGEREFAGEILIVDKRLTNTFVIVKDIDSNKKIRVSTQEQNDFLPGDEISLKGTVEYPEDFVTSNGRIFDYEEYLKNKDIVAVMENPQIEILKKGGFSFPSLATSARHRIHEIYSQYVTFPFDGILSAMIFGYQGGVPTWATNLWRDTGVLHMLVLSGYNITLMALFLSIILRPLPFKVRTSITILFIFAIVMISGGGIASIRAGIMGSIALFAGMAKRTYNPLRAMTLAYLFFFFITPNTIFSDPGFHLSFLATFFMVFILPKTEKFFRFLPNYKYLNLREIISLAILMPIFTLPYIMYFSGNFPLISPIANAVLSIFVPTIMILGIVLLLICWITPIATILGTIISILGNAIIFFLQKISIIPIWNTPPIPWWSVTLLYLILIIILFKKEIILYLMQIRNSLLQQTSSFAR